MTNIGLAKRALRAAHRSRRLALPPSERESRSRSICGRVLPLTRSARRIALFWPIVQRGEVDLRALDAELRDQGKELYYPWSSDGRGPDANCFRRLLDPRELELHRLGFAQPWAEATQAIELDLIIVPGLAATRAGARLGYGAGYYDRALAARPEADSAVVVYDFELCDDLPIEPHDVSANWVVTESEAVGPLASESGH